MALAVIAVCCIKSSTQAPMDFPDKSAYPFSMAPYSHHHVEHSSSAMQQHPAAHSENRYPTHSHPTPIALSVPEIADSKPRMNPSKWFEIFSSHPKIKEMDQATNEQEFAKMYSKLYPEETDNFDYRNNVMGRRMSDALKAYMISKSMDEQSRDRILIHLKHQRRIVYFKKYGSNRKSKKQKGSGVKSPHQIAKDAIDFDQRMRKAGIKVDELGAKELEEQTRTLYLTDDYYGGDKRKVGNDLISFLKVKGFSEDDINDARLIRTDFNRFGSKKSIETSTSTQTSGKSEDIKVKEETDLLQQYKNQFLGSANPGEAVEASSSGKHHLGPGHTDFSHHHASQYNTNAWNPFSQKGGMQGTHVFNSNTPLSPPYIPTMSLLEQLDISKSHSHHSNHPGHSSMPQQSNWPESKDRAASLAEMEAGHDWLGIDTLHQDRNHADDLHLFSLNHNNPLYQTVSQAPPFQPQGHYHPYSPMYPYPLLPSSSYSSGSHPSTSRHASYYPSSSNPSDSHYSNSLYSTSHPSSSDRSASFYSSPQPSPPHSPDIRKLQDEEAAWSELVQMHKDNHHP